MTTDHLQYDDVTMSLDSWGTTNIPLPGHVAPGKLLQLVGRFPLPRNFRSCQRTPPQGLDLAGDGEVVQPQRRPQAFKAVVPVE